MESERSPLASRPPILTPAMFWFFVGGTCVLVALHLLFGLIAAGADGREGWAAVGFALGSGLLSPVAPLALVLGILAARRGTRTREHLVVGAVITLAALLLLRGHRAARDLDRIDERQRDAVLLGVADACRSCATDLGAKICDAYCACLRERVRSEDRSSFRSSRIQSKMATIQERCLAEAEGPP